MQKKILISLLVLMLCTCISFGAYIFYGLFHNLDSEKAKNLVLETEKRLQEERISTITSEKIAYEKYLSYSGVLHYIPITGRSENGGSGVLIADSYDAVRFHNTLTRPVTLDIYESEDTTVSPITTVDIQSGAVSFFSLKKSGMYAYKEEDQKGVIVIGKDYFDQYNLSSFLKKEIFPLFNSRDSYSIHTALLRFKEITGNNTLISKNCHNLAHEIGHEAFHLFGFSQSIASGQDDVCAGGFTHGVLESYFLSDPGLVADPESACQSIEDRRKGSCFHGVGHGLMFTSRNDVTESLIGCRKLSTSVWKNRCAEGVFMELYSGDLEHVGGKVGYSVESLFSPCTTYGSGSESYVCGFFAGLGYLRYQSEDYSGALSKCSTGGPYSNMCIRGIGKEIAKRYIGDALKLENLCSPLSTPDAQKNCLEGGINYTKLQFDDDPTIIAGYCRGFQTFSKICTGESLIDLPVSGSGSAI